MSTHLLPIYVKNAEYNILKNLDAFGSVKLGFEEALNFCNNFRILAIAKLFLECRGDEFSSMLHKSGTAFAFFLGNAPTAIQITSKMSPFFDAVACGDLECAATIAILASTQWNGDYEYEEDFLYMRLLMDHSVRGKSVTDCLPLMQRYSELCKDKGDPRYDVFNALLNSNSDDFASAIGDFLTIEKDRFERFVKAGAILPEHAETEGKLSVEGLALVRLAEMKGLRLEDDYLFIPSSVRKVPKHDWRMDDWRTF